MKWDTLLSDVETVMNTIDGVVNVHDRPVDIKDVLDYKADAVTTYNNHTIINYWEIAIAAAQPIRAGQGRVPLGCRDTSYSVSLIGAVGLSFDTDIDTKGLAYTLCERVADTFSAKATVGDARVDSVASKVYEAQLGDTLAHVIDITLTLVVRETVTYT